MKVGNRQSRCGVYVKWNIIRPQKKKILPFATTWMNLQGIMLSKINQTGNDKFPMSLLICGI